MSYFSEIQRLENARQYAQRNFAAPDRYLKNIKASVYGTYHEGKKGGDEEYMLSIERELGIEYQQIMTWRQQVLYMRLPNFGQ